MMTFELANSPWMYALGALVCLFVLGTSIAFLVRARNDAKRLGMDPSVVRKTAVSSIVFSLLPSVSILIGVISLSGTLGIPLPWIRLSVIGALHYEQTAVEVAAPGVTMAAMTKEQFVTIATVMTIFILSGPLFCLFGFKRYDKKILAKAKQTNADATLPDQKKRSFAPILFNAAFIALICSFLAEQIAKMKNVGNIAEHGKLGSYTPLVVILVSFGVMALMDFLAKHFHIRWLNDFAIGIAMLAGMASAVLIEVLL